MKCQQMNQCIHKDIEKISKKILFENQTNGHS